MADALLSSFLAKPAVPNPPRRVSRDWLLVGIAVPAVILEGIFREQVTWRPVCTIVVLLMVFTLLWRRTAPLATTFVAFGAIAVFDQVAMVFDRPPSEFYSSAVLLFMPYALFRWASGRHAAIGSVVLVAAMVSSLVTSWTNVGDAIGGAIVLSLPAVVGFEVRIYGETRARDLHDAKLRERELLARELHDTVAHHVSAIAIRAQAGQVVGANDPAGAIDALAVIESEASRTLAEMRSIVRALRDQPNAEYAPQPGLDDIERLAHHDDDLAIQVDIADDLGDVGPTVSNALYRVAQESVTNARRHASGASQVTLTLTSDNETVRLIVDDDGRRPGLSDNSGFGVIGMTERAELLGGSLTAGPRRGDASDCGWRVDATIPRREIS